MMKLKHTFIICSLMLAVFVAPVAEAEFKRNYIQGKKSFEDGDYSEAVKKLEAAISDNSESAARVKLYGMRYDSYLPHYYLGEAYFRLNDCTSAMAAWNQALQLGVIQGQDEFRSMQSNMANCEVDVVEKVDVSRIAAEAGSEIDALDAAIESFSGLQNESLLRQEWASRWQPELSTGQQLEQTLRQRLGVATADSDPDAIETIINDAKRGVREVADSERLARVRITTIQSQSAEAERLARESARSELQNAIRLARAAEVFEGSSSNVSSLYADLQRQIGTGENLGATASVLNLQEQTQIISNVLRRYNVSVQNWQAQQRSIAERTPPPGLKRVAEAYFSGDYETVSNLANPDSFDKDRAKIQALLFRAAANHKLFVRSGEQQSATLRQVENDIRAIKRMNSEFSPYIAAFSPRFLALKFR
jgi:tetratricopeptide (TPR) repeat protein